MSFGSKLKLFQVFQVESGTSENENFKMRWARNGGNGKRDGNDGLHVVILGALGLVDLVSNHDGSGRISPCVSETRIRAVTRNNLRKRNYYALFVQVKRICDRWQVREAHNFLIN
jgi:hypothetical protein